MTDPERPAIWGWRPAGLCSFLIIDIVSFSAATRSDPGRVEVRKAMYEALDSSLRATGPGLRGLRDCYHEDRGDGVMVIVPPGIRTDRLLTTVVDELCAAVAEHNDKAPDEALHMRLRVAVHAGEADADDKGVVGAALTHTFRLLDAGPLRDAVRTAASGIAVIVSDRVYEDVVRHGRGGSDRGDYRPVDVEVKETSDRAWIRVPGERPAHPLALAPEPSEPEPAEPKAAEPATEPPPPDPGTERKPPVPDPATVTELHFQVVDALLAIPRLRTERGRDQIVGALPLDIAGAIPRSGEARPDAYAILTTCLDYPGGLHRLLGVVRGFIGDSLAVQRLERAIARLLRALE